MNGISRARDPDIKSPRRKDVKKRNSIYVWDQNTGIRTRLQQLSTPEFAIRGPELGEDGDILEKGGFSQEKGVREALGNSDIAAVH